MDMEAKPVGTGTSPTRKCARPPGGSRRAPDPPHLDLRHPAASRACSAAGDGGGARQPRPPPPEPP
eukprot:gene13345-16439_t